MNKLKKLRKGYNMKLLRSSIGLTSVFLVAACSSVPAQTSPDSSHWRLQNFLDNDLSETIRVYNFCYKEKQSSFVSARDFTEGTHSIVARITQHFNNVDSKSRDAFTTLNGHFENGKTYVFQNDIDGSEATLWIADVDTGKPITSKKTVKLTIPEVVDNEQYQSRRCAESTL
jgi:hypothetical protein